jgi:glycosyltransferase involved in cell wall biosynthesis
VFALSSKSEGISLTLLEAAAAGLPIVATRVGGNAEVVIEGETGMLVSPSDPAAFAAALGAMARRPDRAALGLAGRARVERWFSVERMARAYQDLYADVLHAPR